MILQEMTMAEFKRGLKKSRTLILPYGAVEAHGRHLPLNTDTLIMEEVAKAAVKVVDAFVAPALPYGVCTSTGLHPGTIGISAGTLRAITMDIVRDGFKKGLKNFVLISGHGGGLHVAAMKEAGEALTQEIEGIKIAALSIYEILGPEAFALAETENDSHAGEMETSAILYLVSCQPYIVGLRAPQIVQGKAQTRSNIVHISSGCNAALDDLRGSLRASREAVICCVPFARIGYNQSCAHAPCS